MYAQSQIDFLVVSLKRAAKFGHPRRLRKFTDYYPGAITFLE